MMQKLTDGFLHIGSRVIGPPNILRLQIQIGDVGRVFESAHLEQRQLIGLLWIVLHGASHYNEAMICFPFLGLVIELRHAPAKMHLLKASPISHRKEVFHLGGHNNIAAARLVQILHQLSRKITRVGEETNSRTSNAGGNLFQTALDHKSGSGIAGRVSRTQEAVPELLAMALKAEDRMIGGAAFLSGIVALAGSLLFAIESQDH